MDPYYSNIILSFLGLKRVKYYQYFFRDRCKSLPAVISLNESPRAQVADPVKFRSRQYSLDERRMCFFLLKKISPEVLYFRAFLFMS